MDAETPHSFRGFVVRIVGNLIGLILLYVLSIGPAAVFERRVLYFSTGASEGITFIPRLYQPLWKTATWLGVRVPLYGYCLWWCKSLRFLDQPQRLPASEQRNSN